MIGTKRAATRLHDAAAYTDSESKCDTASYPIPLPDKATPNLRTTCHLLNVEITIYLSTYKGSYRVKSCILGRICNKVVIMFAAGYALSTATLPLTKR